MRRTRGPCYAWSLTGPLWFWAFTKRLYVIVFGSLLGFLVKHSGSIHGLWCSFVVKNLKKNRPCCSYAFTTTVIMTRSGKQPSLDIWNPCSDFLALICRCILTHSARIAAWSVVGAEQRVHETQEITPLIYTMFFEGFLKIQFLHLIIHQTTLFVTPVLVCNTNGKWSEPV